MPRKRADPGGSWPERYRNIKLSPNWPTEKRGPGTDRDGSILSNMRRKSLTAAKKKFLRRLRDEVKNQPHVDRIPRDLLDRLVFTSDLDRRTPVLKRLISGQGPTHMFIHDLFALKGIGSKGASEGPMLLKNPEEFRSHIFNPDEAYVMPIKDSKGRHYMTFVHIGEGVHDEKMGELARSLVADPTGRLAKSQFRKRFDGLLGYRV